MIGGAEGGRGRKMGGPSSVTCDDEPENLIVL